MEHEGARGARCERHVPTKPRRTLEGETGSGLEFRPAEVKPIRYRGTREMINRSACDSFDPKGKKTKNKQTKMKLKKRALRLSTIPFEVKSRGYDIAVRFLSFS
ncbi:hypothetical protein V1478_009944 [Vespula squamosa]|uniref:Uncharacterized protein n=1 Tax=Vespula squamosa TaxID=30214 RepID=A0ABD2AJV5_VESSQ